MTFDEVMAKYNGKWEGGAALIGDQGYTWCIAKGTSEDYELTWDGKRYVSAVAPAPVAEVKSRKRGIATQPVEPPVALSDLDFEE
jgi:hypothetical protein